MCFVFHFGGGAVVATKPTYSVRFTHRNTVSEFDSEFSVSAKKANERMRRATRSTKWVRINVWCFTFGSELYPTDWQWMLHAAYKYAQTHDHLGTQPPSCSGRKIKTNKLLLRSKITGLSFLALVTFVFIFSSFFFFFHRPVAIRLMLTTTMILQKFWIFFDSRRFFSCNTATQTKSLTRPQLFSKLFFFSVLFRFDSRRSIDFLLVPQHEHAEHTMLFCGWT